MCNCKCCGIDSAEKVTVKNNFILRKLRQEKIEQAQEKFSEKLAILVRGFEEETGLTISDIVIGYDSKQ